MHTLSLTTGEVQALQTILAYFLTHTSPEISSVVEKLEQVSNPNLVNYERLKFRKMCNVSWEVAKEYKHSNFEISFKEGK